MAYCRARKCSTRLRPNRFPGACTRARPCRGRTSPWNRPNRQPPSFDDSLPDRLSERGYRLRARLGSGRLGADLRGPGRAFPDLGQPAFRRRPADRRQDRHAPGFRRRVRAWRDRAEVHRAPEHRAPARVRLRQQPLLPRERAARERVAALRAERRGRAAACPRRSPCWARSAMRCSTCTRSPWCTETSGPRTCSSPSATK